jgi:Family of unknown function (DUF6500)
MMRPTLRSKIIAVCDKKIAKEGDAVGLSFYAFFANKNDDPELLMEAATCGSSNTGSTISKKQQRSRRSSNEKPNRASPGSY